MGRHRRALVVSTGRDRGALAAVRALSRAGWFVGVGTPDGGGMTAASRACSARHVVPRPRGDGAAFVEGVRRAGRASGYDVVFGGGDDWSAALAHHADEVGVRVAHPPGPVVTAALDKLRLVESGARAGLATAATAVATDEALAAWHGAVVVKCRAHWAVGDTRPHRIEARRYPDAAAARDQVERIRCAGGEPLLQTPVEGRLGALVGVLRGGRLVGRVQQASPRLWPTPYGASARARTVPVDEELASRAEELLRDLAWEGLVELQFLTGDDGVPYLTDLNGRFYGSLALAEAARPGLVDAWGRSVVGDPIPDLPDGRPGVRYSWFAGDLRRARVERRGSLLADVLATAGWAAVAHHSTWSARDPGPALYLAGERLSGRGDVAAVPPSASAAAATRSAGG